jgi:hypothetical protein
MLDEELWIYMDLNIKESSVFLRQRLFTRHIGASTESSFRAFSLVLAKWEIPRVVLGPIHEGLLGEL